MRSDKILKSFCLRQKKALLGCMLIRKPHLYSLNSHGTKTKDKTKKNILSTHIYNTYEYNMYQLVLIC